MHKPIKENCLIRLAEPDNVLVISMSLEAGETVVVDGHAVALPTRLSLGHKLAARPIARGETVIKYNFPIGVATEDIAVGAHVHVHNMRSSYTPTYTIPEA
ncbi:MAG: UxaA family hydrolase [Hyphomicrobiaceae bacterium]